MSMEKRVADRLRVMNAVYEGSGGDEAIRINAIQLAADLGLDDGEMAAVCRYLDQEHLIAAEIWDSGRATPSWLRITHAGLREMEASKSHPNAPTDHLAPQISVSIHGSVVASPIQIGSPGATQTTTIGEVHLDEIAALRQFVEDYNRLEPQLPAGDQDKLAQRAAIDTILVQVASKAPNRNVLKACLAQVGAFLLPMSSAFAAGELLHALPSLL